MTNAFFPSTARFLLPLVAAGSLAACFSELPDGTDPDNGGQAAVTVQMTELLTFSPQNVTIRVGESVRWRNTSNFPHTATADPQLASNPGTSVRLPPGAQTFHSGDIQPGGQFLHRFDVPGAYTYFCVPHEGGGMIGTITVSP